jgi:hypothetical protein
MIRVGVDVEDIVRAQSVSHRRSRLRRATDAHCDAIERTCLRLALVTLLTLAIALCIALSSS